VNLTASQEEMELRLLMSDAGVKVGEGEMGYQDRPWVPRVPPYAMLTFNW
jgi:hypothetical protein